MTPTTPEEQLAYERHIAEVLKVRQPAGGSSTLKTLLNSSVLTALIGVIGTGIVGALVSSRIQQRAKENELDRKAHEVSLEAQRAAVTKALDKISSLVNASDDLLVSISVAYSEAGRRKDEVAALRKWRTELAQSRDTADRDWRREKKTIGFTLSYLFEGVASVREGWQGVVQAVDNFESCTRQFYSDNAIKLTDVEVDSVCPPVRAAVDTAVDKFTAFVGAERYRDPTNR